VHDGIPSLVVSSELYENQCTNTLELPLIERQRGPLKYLVYLDFLCSERHRRNRFFRRVANRLPRRESVLDIGCGGGMKIWTHLGAVVGLSNSLTGLRQASLTYSGCVHADLYQGLPFPDGSFDYIVACDVIGHFEESVRDMLLAEIHRCLKPGGRFIGVIETIGKLFDVNPELGSAYIDAGIKRAGHIGLEQSTRALQRLAEHDLACDRLELLGPYPGTVEGFFTQYFEELPARTRLLGLAKLVARVVRHNRIATRLTDNVFGVINSAALWYLGVEWAEGIMVSCQRSTSDRTSERVQCE
jgi:SAM-dependent methyltransferase